ncbi:MULTISPECIES: hypothetical protein [unclassified Microbacterium]|uniref:hypothetical protein n=1 Tax=unclassified Microbacterium TaxID=2609290 RepID=UPI00313A27C2
MTPAELAVELNVSPKWVRAVAREMFPRDESEHGGPWRFDLEQVSRLRRRIPTRAEAWVIALDPAGARSTDPVLPWEANEVIAVLPASHTAGEADAALKAAVQIIFPWEDRSELLLFANADDYVRGALHYWDILHPYVQVVQARNLRVESGRLRFDPVLRR